jgi:hypothetical protein
MSGINEHVLVSLTPSSNIVVLDLGLWYLEYFAE